MNWRIEGLKRFDAVFGRIACTVSRVIASPRKRTGSERPRILIIRPGGIGDAVLLFPALKELRDVYPGSVIDVLAEKRNAGILDICPHIDNVILYDQSPHKSLYGVINGGYDIVIDTEQWHRMTAAVAYLTRAPVRAGFDTNERSRLYSHKVPYSHGDYEALSFLNLVSAVSGRSLPFDADEPFISPGSTVGNGVSDELTSFSRGKSALVGIFTGASVEERKWGAAKYAEMAAELIKIDIGIVLLGGKADIEASSDFGRALGEYSPGARVLDFTGKTRLPETAYAISQLNLFISSDSGLMHIAYAVGTPTLSLFGAGIESKWAPRGASHRTINKNLPCSPCTKFGYTPRCPYEVRCLSEISTGEVAASARTMLNPPA